MKVVIIGPNLPARLADKGTFHVHAEGCRDILIRYPKDLTECESPVEVDSKKAAVLYCYPAFDYEYDPSNPDEFSIYYNDFYWAPCTKELPE